MSYFVCFNYALLQRHFFIVDIFCVQMSIFLLILYTFLLYTAIQSAKKLLTYPDAQMEDTKHELYSIIADNYMYQDNITEAISWLDRILAESSNTELIEHTKKVKEDWTTLL